MNAGEQIEKIRTSFGKRLLILGHYYQQDEVLRHSDIVGDSLELARRAAASRSAERVVLCGVHFMAESADLLTGEDQTVYMPDPESGCPMADMASADQAQRAWQEFAEYNRDLLPVVYVNSTAALKAFCGEREGSACTSSNATKVFQWVLDQGKRVFFLPDEHLGTNTAHDLGVPDEEVAVYDPAQARGGLSSDAMRRARIVVWKGYCHVHTVFREQDITRCRARNSQAGSATKIVVHPEAVKAVVRMADAHGSTSQIIRYVESLPAGTTVYIGTELHLVNRLARQHEGRLPVRPLVASGCPDMARTTEQNLLSLLEQWPVENKIHVPDKFKPHARRALARMLEL